jgi:hypothetical protein
MPFFMIARPGAAAHENRLLSSRLNGSPACTGREVQKQLNLKSYRMKAAATRAVWCIAPIDKRVVCSILKALKSR